MNILGYCKECSTPITDKDSIGNDKVYDCPNCYHPHSIGEMRDRPFEICNHGGTYETVLNLNVKPVPLIDLIMPLLENMSNEELEQLYEELKTE